MSRLKIVIHNNDAFEESKHPRASNGEFGSGSRTKPSAAAKPGHKAISPGKEHEENAKKLYAKLTPKEKAEVHSAAEEEGWTPIEYLQESNSPADLKKKLKMK